MASNTKLFELWQEADGLATAAERIASKALSDHAKGHAAPDELGLEVARALRRTARERLRAAAAAYRMSRDG